MNRFPRYGPLFPYYKPYNSFYSPSHVSHLNSNQKSENKCKTEKKENSKDTVWLDLFGIKLYFDDILILSLLFFLYKEDVKDEGLFLALVMLLIS